MVPTANMCGSDRESVPPRANWSSMSGPFSCHFLIDVENRLVRSLAAFYRIVPADEYARQIPETASPDDVHVDVFQLLFSVGSQQSVWKTVPNLSVMMIYLLVREKTSKAKAEKFQRSRSSHHDQVMLHSDKTERKSRFGQAGKIGSEIFFESRFRIFLVLSRFPVLLFAVKQD